MGDLLHLQRQTVSLPLGSIVEPEFQVRTYYSESKLLELAASLEEEGMFYPLLVSDRGDGSYEVHAGSRRLRAARLKGFAEIPAFVVELDGPAHAVQLALTENLQRQDLDPFEEARGFLRLVYEHEMSQKEVASKLKCSEAFIRKRLALLSLPEAVQDDIASGALGLHFASTLVKLPTGEMQAHYATLAIEKNLTQAELRALIAKDDDENVRISMRGISVEKIIARAEIQKRWFRKIPSKIDLRRMTSEERGVIAKELENLERVLCLTRKEIVSPGKMASELFKHVVDGPGNHGQEWTLSHINEISASDRPSDKVLAKKLGRTVGAIAGMRSKANN